MLPVQFGGNFLIFPKEKKKLKQAGPEILSALQPLAQPCLQDNERPIQEVRPWDIISSWQKSTFTEKAVAPDAPVAMLIEHPKLFTLGYYLDRLAPKASQILEKCGARTLDICHVETPEEMESVIRGDLKELLKKKTHPVIDAVRESGGHWNKFTRRETRVYALTAGGEIRQLNVDV